MRSYLRLIRVLTVALLGACAGHSVSSAQVTPHCSPYPAVDLRAASVAGVGLDTTISALRSVIGSGNIRRYMVDSESGRVAAYSLRICGHLIERFQDGVRWTDSAFHSPEGLGVGAPLSAFDSAFGIGEVSGDQGLAVRYELDRRKLYVEVGDCYTIEPPVSTVDRRCGVIAIALLLSNRP